MVGTLFRQVLDPRVEVVATSQAHPVLLAAKEDGSGKFPKGPGRIFFPTIRRFQTSIFYLFFFFFLKLLVSPGHSCGRHPHPHPPGFGMGSKLDLNSVLPLTVWTRLVSCLNLILPSVRWRYCAAAARTDSDHTHKHSYHTAWHVDEAQQIRIHWFSESSELK